MIVSNCPRCNEAIRVPNDALPEHAYARCPWCRDTYPLNDVLAKLPPIVEILSADGEPLNVSRQVTAAAFAGGAVSSGAAVAGNDESSFTREKTHHGGASLAETDVDLGVSDDFFELDAAVGEDLAGKATVTEETVTEESWGQDASESIGEAGQDVEFALQDTRETWGERPSSASLASMKVSPSSSKKKKQSKFAAMRAAISVILGGALALPLADGLLVLFGQPGFGVWSAILGSKDDSQGGSAVAAAAPAKVAADRGSSLTKPSGRLLDPSASEFELQPASDPADAALEQIMGQPSGSEAAVSESSVSESSVSESDVSDPLLAETTEAVAEPGSTNGLDPAEPERGRDRPERAGASIKMPAAKGEQESAVRMVPIETARNESAAVETDLLSETSSTAAPQEVEPALPKRKPSPVPEVGSTQSPFPETDPAAAIPTANEPAELIAAADRAAAMVEALATYDGPQDERKKQLARTYAEIAAACDLGTEESGALRSLATTIAHSSNLSDIEFAATQWLSYQKRGSNGIALIGRPGTDGDGPTITLDTGKVVSVSGNKRLPSTAKVVAIGRVLDESTVQVFLAEALP